MLDAGPLGRIAHPRPNRDVTAWLEQLLHSGGTVIIPEIADYEVRRNLVLEGRDKSIGRLDQLRQALGYSPITTGIMRQAAEFWASSRK
jgi:hypothetical protein